MSQDTSIKRDSSTTVRSRMPLEFNKSAIRAGNVITSSLFQRPGGCWTLVPVCFFIYFGGWQFTFFHICGIYGEQGRLSS